MLAQSLSKLSETHKLHNLIAACSALLLGGMLMLTVGFAPVQSLHNAAHDTRHSAAFPCH
ncbi:MAG: CbtB-domain containing protein [Methylococcaceae bacterium]|nr:CbtB-domain containing protein [Methylococcaceae bacterium]